MVACLTSQFADEQSSVIAVVFVWFLLKKTTLGFEIVQLVSIHMQVSMLVCQQNVQLSFHVIISVPLLKSEWVVWLGKLQNVYVQGSLIKCWFHGMVEGLLQVIPVGIPCSSCCSTSSWAQVWMLQRFLQNWSALGQLSSSFVSVHYIIERFIKNHANKKWEVNKTRLLSQC